MNCLTPEQLQDLHDSKLVSVDAREHIRNCGCCRDALRNLERVSQYLRFASESVTDEEVGDILGRVRSELQGESTKTPTSVEAPVTHPSMGEDPGMSHTARAARSSLRSRAWLPMLCAASLILVCLLTWPFLKTTPQAPEMVRPQVHTAELPSIEITGLLRAAVPDLADPSSPANLDAEDIKGVEDLLRATRAPWGDLTEQDAVRLLRVLALQADTFVDLRHWTRWLQRVHDDNLWNHGLVSLAMAGGPRSRVTIEELATKRKTSPEILAEALIATGSNLVAGRAFDLLTVSGMHEGLAYQVITRCPVDSVNRFLATSLLAGDDNPVLTGLLLDRPKAHAMLRRGLPKVRLEVRVRILRVLGAHGDQDAIQTLQRTLRTGCELEAASAALARIAREGSTAALAALASELPTLDDAKGATGHPMVRRLRQAFRSLPASAEAYYQEAIRRETSNAQRRRYWLALGLCGTEARGEFWERALSGQDVRPALMATTLIADPDSVSALASLLHHPRRSIRVAAIDLLAQFGTNDAAKHLAGAMGVSVNRQRILRVLKHAGAWARPVFKAGLKYASAKSDCLQRLDQLASTLEESKTERGSDPPSKPQPPGTSASYLR